MAYYEGEISPITGGGYGGMGWGDSSWWIIVLLIFGWGGFGRGYGGYGGASGAADNYVLATDFATIERKLDSISNGICDSTFALNNTVVNGFNNLGQNIITQGYETRNAISGVSTQLASCCCDIQRALLENRYIDAKEACDTRNAIATSTRDILDGQRASTDAILGFLTNEKISALQARNAELSAQLSQQAQSAYLLEQLKGCPKPAYIVPNPNCCYNTCGTAVL